MPSNGLGFRRFLPEALRLTEVAALKSEEPATPPRPFLTADRPTRDGGTPTHSPSAKRPEDLARSQERTVKPLTVTRARRAPAYVWLSQESRNARSTAVDFYNLKF